MAGVKVINNIYNHDNSFEPETESKTYLKKGYLSIEFTNMGNANEKKLKANSIVDINGNIYKFDIAPGGDETIEGVLPTDGTAYARFYVDIDTAKIEWTTDALPDFDYNKKGYYDASNRRYVFKVEMNSGIIISEEIILNSYIVEDKAWENRLLIGDKLVQASNWSLNFPAPVGFTTQMGYVEEPFNKMYATFSSSAYVSSDGKNWSASGTSQDRVPVASPTLNRAVAQSGTADATSPSSYSSNLSSWTAAPAFNIWQDVGAASYQSTTAGEQLGFSASYCRDTGCQGAPGYNSNQGRVLWASGTSNTYFNGAGSAGSEFGYSISVDVEQDINSYGMFLIGAPGANKAYQYEFHNSATINLIATFTSPDAGASNRFGHASGTSGAYKIISAPGFGKSYIYYNNAYQATINGVGEAVAIAGDRAAVSDVANGRVFIYKRSGTSWSAIETIYGYESFGSSIAMFGNNMIIGEPTNSKVYIYSWDGSIFNQTHTITESGDFGSKVVMADIVYAVSAPSLDRVYVYKVSDNSLTQVMTPRPNTNVSNWFESTTTGVSFGSGLGIFNYNYSGTINYRIAVGAIDYGTGGRTEYYLKSSSSGGNVFQVQPDGWNQDLEEFYAYATIDDGSYPDDGSFFVTSSDGINWTVKNRIIYIDNDNPIELYFMWNRREQKYIARYWYNGNGGGGSFSSTNGGYNWVYDGIWQGLTKRLDDAGWANSLGLYYFMGNNGDNSTQMTTQYFYLSADGINYTQTNSTPTDSKEWYKVKWIEELHMFIVTGNRGNAGADQYNFMYSHDGITWTYIMAMSDTTTDPTGINYFPSGTGNPGMIVIQTYTGTDAPYYTTMINK